jgi:hypothetical protein
MINLSSVSDLSLQHLQAQLARIDILIQHELRRWQIAGQDPNDAYRGLYVSDKQADALMARAFTTHWGDSVMLDLTEDEAFNTARLSADEQVHELEKAAHDQHQKLLLEHISTAFNLDRFDQDAFLICLAPSLDLRYERLYGYLQDDIARKRPGISLILNLLCTPGSGRLINQAHFDAHAPLLKHHLLEFIAESGNARMPLLDRGLMVDETVTAWLLGRYEPGSELYGHVELTHPKPNEIHHLLAGQIFSDATLSDYASSLPILVFFGADTTAQAASAQLLAAHYKKSLLTINLNGAASEEIPLREIMRLALRDASLLGALPYITGIDEILQEGTLPLELLREIVAHPDLIIFSSKEAWQLKGLVRERLLYNLEFKFPSYTRRCDLWNHFLPNLDCLDKVDFHLLSGQFRFDTGQIRDVAASARDLTLQLGRALTKEDLFSIARACSNPRLSGQARKIDSHYSWDDIILPQDQIAQLREIVAAVRERAQVLEVWGVGEKLATSSGVAILFAGPPGTGKTMSAEIIAGELGLDLYKIDLSTMVSKYVGETEKNLERVFTEAQNSSAILFFDEADALFGERSEVHDSHDRYANIEISYLLQRMEIYDGVTILATNLRANLDKAFLRRLQFAIDFPFPDEDDRLRIWQTLFPAKIPVAPDLDFSLLAHRFRLAGGNIRNIIVNAAYLAASDGMIVNMEHLFHGARRELQKMGRLIAEEDLKV